MSIADFSFINKKIPLADVAVRLGLRLGTNGNFHCWRPESHKNGDRTASASVRKTNNTLKCFGCDIGPFSNLDLVMAVLGFTNVGEAAKWVAGEFDVPDLPRGKHLVHPERPRFQVGFEKPIGLLINSGLWASISLPARAIVPVLLEFGKIDPGKETLTLKMAYRTIGRFSGGKSPNAVSRALKELIAIGWLRSVRPHNARETVVRETGTYIQTPKSDELVDLAHRTFKQFRHDIEVQREARDADRLTRQRQLVT